MSVLLGPQEEIPAYPKRHDRYSLHPVILFRLYSMIFTSN